VYLSATPLDASFRSGYTTDDIERILDDLIDAPTLRGSAVAPASWSR
jgi:hypothetical protein